MTERFGNDIISSENDDDDNNNDEDNNDNDNNDTENNDDDTVEDKKEETNKKEKEEENEETENAFKEKETKKTTKKKKKKANNVSIYYPYSSVKVDKNWKEDGYKFTEDNIEPQFMFVQKDTLKDKSLDRPFSISPGYCLIPIMYFRVSEKSQPKTDLTVMIIKESKIKMPEMINKIIAKINKNKCALINFKQFNSKVGDFGDFDELSTDIFSDILSRFSTSMVPSDKVY